MNWIKYGEFYDKFCKNSNKLELYKKLKNLQDWKKRNKSKKPDFNRISFKDWNEVDEVLNQVVQQAFGVENWSDFHSILSQTHDWYESLDEIFFPLKRVKEIPKYAENWESFKKYNLNPSLELFEGIINKEGQKQKVVINKRGRTFEVYSENELDTIVDKENDSIIEYTEYGKENYVKSIEFAEDGEIQTFAITENGKKVQDSSVREDKNIFEYIQQIKNGIVKVPKMGINTDLSQYGKPDFSISIRKNGCYWRYNEGKGEKDLRGKIDFPLKNIKDNTSQDFIEGLMESIIELEIKKSAKDYMVNRLKLISEYITNKIKIPKELTNGLIEIDYRDLSDKNILDIFRGYSQKSCDRIYRTAEKFKRMGLVSTDGIYARQLTIFDKIRNLFTRREMLPSANINEIDEKGSKRKTESPDSHVETVSDNRNEVPKTSEPYRDNQPKTRTESKGQQEYPGEEGNRFANQPIESSDKTPSVGGRTGSLHSQFAKKISNSACDEKWDPIIKYLEDINKRK